MLERPADTVRLSNGVRIPCLGLGTWQLPDGDALRRSLLSAFRIGYRHIDTASVYGNERTIGEAIRESGIPREEFFITDKVWNNDRGYDTTLRSFERSAELLGTGYIDLYMIHWPASHGEPMTWQAINSGTWRALEELYAGGKVRAIGVSNFLPHHLVPLLAKARVAPMVNSLEFHPGYPQFQALRYCRGCGMRVLGWSPLARGGLGDNPLLAALARKHRRSVSQVCLRWSLEHGVLPLPRSLLEAHQRENAEIFDFSLTLEEIKRIDAMPQAGFSGLHPDYVTY